MGEVNLELLGRRMEQLVEGQHEIIDRLERVEATMATREQLNRLWRAVEGKIELGRDELLDTTAAVERRTDRRLDDIEVRLRRLEEAQERR